MEIDLVGYAFSWTNIKGQVEISLIFKAKFFSGYNKEERKQRRKKKRKHIEEWLLPVKEW